MRTLLFLTILLSFASALAEEGKKRSFYDDSQRGWYWHEKPPVVEEAIENAPTPTEPSESGENEKYIPFSVEHIRQSLPLLRDAAINDPSNEEAMLSWAVMQRVMLDRSSEFAFRNRNLFLKFPELSEERLMKTSGAALIMREDEVKANRKALFKELAKRVSVFYFYRADCPWCQKQGSLVSMFRDQTTVDVLPVSFDGGGPTGDFNYFRLANELDESFLRDLGITQVPATYMVMNDGSEITQLSDGFATLEALKERFILLSEEKGLIDQEDLNKVTRAKRIDFLEGEMNLEETDDPDEVLRQVIRDRFGLSDDTKSTSINDNSLN